MDKFWKAALAVGGLAAIGAFVFWSLYKNWLSLPIFSQMSADQTFAIMKIFLILTFIAMIALVVAYLIRHNETKVGNTPPANRIIMSIPDGWTFEDTARSIVNVATAVISFEGFEPDQLSQKLRATEINTTDVQEALLLLRYQAEHLPAYQIHFEKGVYHIRV